MYIQIEKKNHEIKFSHCGDRKKIENNGRYVASDLKLFCSP